MRACVPMRSTSRIYRDSFTAPLSGPGNGRRTRRRAAQDDAGFGAYTLDNGAYTLDNIDIDKLNRISALAGRQQLFSEHDQRERKHPGQAHD